VNRHKKTDTQVYIMIISTSLHFNRGLVLPNSHLLCSHSAGENWFLCRYTV